MKFIDVHSHILPELDDGSKSMEQSVSMLRIAFEEGIGTIIATPHNMPGKGCPSAEKIQRRITALRQAAKEEGIPVKIFMGTEYFFREEVLELLEENQAITYPGTNCVLVEFDPFADKLYIRNAAREIWALGYVPVLAHVERYASLMERDYAVIADMQKMGALIQVNCSSVIGENGRKVQKDVKALLKAGLVDLVGTDAHSDGRRAPRMLECEKYIEKKFGSETAEQLFRARALRREMMKNEDGYAEQ